MRPFAIILFGSPGSGKSTQADLLAKKLEITHFNTGKFLEHYINDSENRKNPYVRKIKKQFDTGLLIDPPFVLDVMKKYVGIFEAEKESLVFSGSPRTEYEAVGDAEHPGLMRMLEKAYGKKRIAVFELLVPEETAKKRNAKRLVCSSCGAPLLGTAFKLALRACPFCGGKLYKRTLDDLQTIDRRFREYKERTVPIFLRLKKMGYAITPIPAVALPYKIFKELSKRIDKKLK